MKKTLALVMSVILCLGLLAACGSEPSLTGAELAAHYKEAIEAGRTEADNTDRPLSYTGSEEETGSLIWESLGFTEADVDAYAFYLSLMNVQAYCVGLFKPVEGKAEAVVAGLENYIAGQQRGFESYLPDQGVIADNAILETLDDGTVIIVMSDGWDDVYAGITEAL